jgi:membrane-bound lytic murein transglycosylase D
MNQLENGAPLMVGSELRVPTAVVNLPAKVMLAAARVDGGADRRGRRPTVHVVRSGDSLWRIAKRHRMDVNTLARMNGMGPGDTLRTGQKLVLNTRAAPSGKSSSGGSRPTSYKVRSGDTLSRIAQVFGVSVSDLVNWNGISKNSVLRPGQKLTVNARSR